MSTAAVLHNVNCELQALVTRRLAMTAANHEAIAREESLPYGEKAFDELAGAIRACSVDPQNV